MKYLSVCSGIEAASVAWGALGWEAVGFSEIEAFPSAVLRHHYPAVPNLGDMTKYQEWEIERPDVLVGGTPCQSFSVAGLRKGLADPRGNLALVYCGIIDRFRPKWFVWENVPGVLSSGGGRDFGSFLGAVVELGYGFAYRVLDAQFFGVPQRRRRVFVVGYLGDWRPAAAVLFERESLRRDSAPSREAGQEVAGTFTARAKSGGWGQDPNLAASGYMRVAPTVTSGAPFSRTGNGSEAEAVVEVCPTLRAGGNRTGGDRPPGTDVDTADSLIVQPYPVANTLTARMHKGINSTLDEGQTPVVQAIAIQDVTPREKAQNGKGWNDDGTAYTVDTHATQGVAQPITQYGEIAGSLTARHDSSPCADRGQNVVAFNARQDPDSWVDRTGPLDTNGSTQAVAQHIAFTQNQRNEVRTLEVAGALAAEPGMKQQTYLQTSMQVRRLTPVECERLQGFPDGYTNVPWRGKPESPDGPRYKALGNSMAVPVMRWIGERITTASIRARGER
jgi:DNA (cytosine-5)-methyltransferase 1